MDTEELLQLRRDNLDQGIDQIYDNIVNKNYDLYKLPEELFKQYYVPFFSGKVTDPSQVDDLRRHWFAIANGPWNEVSIIDTAGNELFKVPPFLSQYNIHVRYSGEQESMESYLLTYQAILGNSMPGNALNFLARNLDGMIAKYSNPKIYQEHQDRWIEILKRYGIEFNSVENPKDVPQATESGFEY